MSQAYDINDFKGTSAVGNYTAGATVVKDRAVRLAPDGLIYPMDHKQNAVVLTTNFGDPNVQRILDTVYIEDTKQVLAVASIGNKPYLYIGRVNSTTGAIAWAPSVVLSTDSVRTGTSGKLHYDRQLGVVVFVFVEMTSSVGKYTRIKKTNETYTIEFTGTVPDFPAVFSVDVTSNELGIFISGLTTDRKICMTCVSSTNALGSAAVLLAPIHTTTAIGHTVTAVDNDTIAVVTYNDGNVYLSVFDAVSKLYVVKDLSFDIDSQSLSSLTMSIVYDPVDRSFRICYSGNRTAKVFYLKTSLDFTAIAQIHASVVYFAASSDYHDCVMLNQRMAVVSRKAAGLSTLTVIDIDLLVEKIQQSLPVTDAMTVFLTDRHNAPFIVPSLDVYGFSCITNATLPSLYCSVMRSKVADQWPMIGIAKSGILKDAVTAVTRETGIHTFETIPLGNGANYYASADGTITALQSENPVGMAVSNKELIVKFTKDVANPVPSKAVIENTIKDPSLVSTPGRYIVPLNGTGDFEQRKNEYADFDGSLFAYSTPNSGDKIIVNVGVNAGKTYEYKDTGTALEWVGVSETTPMSIMVYNSAVACLSGKLYLKDNVLLQANDDIPAGSEVIIGINGKTFKQIGLSSAGDLIRLNSQTLNISAGAGTTDANYDTGLQLPLSTVTDIVSSGDISVIGNTIKVANPGYYKIYAAVEGIDGGIDQTDIWLGYGVNSKMITKTYDTIQTGWYSPMSVSDLVILGKNDIIDFRMWGVGGLNEIVKIRDITIIVEKIGGSMAVTGQSVDAGKFIASGAVAANMNLNLSTLAGNIQNFDSTTIVLKGGVAYSGSALLNIPCTVCKYQWVDEYNNPLSGSTQGTAVSANGSSAENNIPSEFMLTPNSDTKIRLRIQSITAYTGTAAILATSPISVHQLGAAANTFLQSSLTRSHLSLRFSNSSQAVTPITGNPVIFDVKDGGDIPYNFTTGRWTLKAGKTYKLQAFVRPNLGPGGFMLYNFWNLTDNKHIGQAGEYILTYENTATNMVNGLITPDKDIEVILRYGNLNNVLGLFSVGWAFIEEVGYSTKVYNGIKESPVIIYNEAGQIVPKATTPLFDKQTIIDLGGGYKKCILRYGYNNRAGTVNNSTRSYVFDLNDIFDEAVHSFNTQSGSLSGFDAATQIIPAIGRMSLVSVDGANSYYYKSVEVVPYTSSSFRLLVHPNDAANYTFIGNQYFVFSGKWSLYLEFTFKSAA